MITPPSYLQAAVDISHLGARVSDEGLLLEAAADSLRRSLDLVAVQIYVVDASGQLGQLRHHAGAGDRATVLKSPDVAVGANSALGELLSGGGRRVIEDARDLPRGAMPPGAKHAVALPLIVEGRTLGALIFYEDEPVSVLEVSDHAPIADIVALALEEVRERASEQKEPPSGEQIGLHRSASAHLGNPAQAASGPSHTAPISLRGSVVGSLTLRERSERALDEDEVGLIRSVADEVGQAIEYLDLRKDAQQAAARERLLTEITAELQRATTVEDLLHAAASTVRRALGNVEVTARLAPDVMVAAAHDTSQPGERGRTVDDGAE